MSQFSGLKEAIEHIELTKADALGVQVLPIPTPEHKRWVRNGQVIEEVDVTPGLRRLHIDTIEDLYKLAILQHDNTSGIPSPQALFVSRSNVTLIFDVNNGRESASLRFKDSEEHKALHGFIESPLRSAGDLRANLRLILGETIPSEKLERLVKQVSQVVWRADDVGSVNLDRKGESLGASINRSIQSDAGLPDEMQMLNVRRFANMDIKLRTPVKCLLDPDHSARKWYFRPIEQSWADYQDAALLYVRDTLTGLLAENEVKIPVFLGAWDQTKCAVPAESTKV